MQKCPDLIIANIRMLATPTGRSAKKAKEQGQVLIIENAFVAIAGGEIIKVGKTPELKDLPRGPRTEVVDAGNALVTPGLVDAHTHLVFGGWRQNELALKLKGVSYLEILKNGGGILNTVEKTRQATQENLVEKGRKSLDRMLSYGTTTCEAKSGYGLNLEHELKSLRAVEQLQEIHPIDIVSTFMGAHAIPREYQDCRKEYVDLVCEEMIPCISAARLAEYCDVFCEDKAFSLEESRQILECGSRYGLIPKIHADEITSLGGAQLAAEVGAISAEHLIYASDEGLSAMAAAGTIAVLLPATSFYLGEGFARAKKMIELGIPVAVATDFNPGSSPNESLQLPMNTACLKYRLTPEEVLTAVTLNAAAAINRSGTIGSIEEGKKADLVIWEAPDLDFIFYHYGVNLVKQVIKNGRVIKRSSEDEK